MALTEHSWAATDANDVVIDRSGLRSINEARDLGLRTVHSLDVQAETLHHAHTVADSNKYVLDQSERVIRGMTWWGWMQNKFTAAPRPPSPHASPPTLERTPASAAQPPREALFAGHRELGVESDPQLREQNEYVQEVGRGLDELLEVGAAMGNRIEEQNNESVPQLHEKIEGLWHMTRHMTRRAGRVTESYGWSRATPRLLGHVALQHTETKRYLRARGDDVCLSEEVDCLRATCRFKLYEKRAHLLGLQSAVSMHYVGLTFSGNIRCNFRRFNRCQEFDFDLSRPNATPILCIASNFGDGLWVRVKDGNLVPAYPRDEQGALQKAAKFRVVFLDDAFEIPTYAEAILRPKKLQSSGDDDPVIR